MTSSWCTLKVTFIMRNGKCSHWYEVVAVWIWNCYFCQCVEMCNNKICLFSWTWLPIWLNISSLTRRSENDNTPQPLDQWTNSPFTGQQVGNCKSFTLTHYLADLFVMLRGPRSIPLCIQHHIQFTSLSFQVSQTSHYWVENLRSRSWVRSKFEVTMWV